MEVLVASHPSSLLHDTGAGHPESSERVRAIRRGIAASGVDVVEIEAPEIRRSELELVHASSYIEMVEAFCSMGGGALDMDTVLSEDTWRAALTAAGSVRVLVDELGSARDAFGFAVTRPPGHHAHADRAMGFCIFNNVAVVAAIRRSLGERVAILDWDVHHGNGTQSMVADDEGVLYVSIHQDHHYPFEGLTTDIDTAAEGTVVNIPLPAGTTGQVYRRAWSEIVTPVVAEFAPDWLFISAGYDAHVDDPLASMGLIADDYGWLASEIASVHPASRIVVAMEGGYDLDALERSAAATVVGLAGAGSSWESPPQSPPGADIALAYAAEAVRHHWSI